MTKKPRGRLRGALAIGGAVLVALAAALVIGILGPFEDGAPERAGITPESVGPAGTGGPAPRAPVHLDQERAAAIGVRVVPVTRTPMTAELRAVVTIVPDEGRVSHVHTRVSGWIQELFVSTTGERVRRGQRLAAIFSQELLASQSELLAALSASPPGAPSPIAQGARSRLRVLGMTAPEIASLERRGEPWRNVTIVAPRAGVILHRGISVGTSVDPSTELFTVVDLSHVWAIAEVPEATAAQVREGTTARLDVPGSGMPPLEARVDFVYPTLSERTRTVRVRFALDNADGALRPGMFGTAVFAVAARDALTLPRDAVVDTGIRQHVFVAAEDGSFVPRVVELGLREDERVEIASGLVEGERVVAAGVFLVDSESRLRASGGGTGHAHGGTTTETSAAEREGRRPTPGADPHAGHGAP